jgi:hypothetical protein
MILIDLIPPGLTFQALVGPAQGTRAQPAAVSGAGQGQPLSDRADRLVRRMELTADTELLQSYRISQHEQSAPSPATAPPAAPWVLPH